MNPIKMSVYASAYTMTGNTGPYGIAAVIIDNLGKQAEITDSGKRSKSSRADLKAVILGLDDCVEGTTITLHTDSKYVYHGMTEGLSQWQADNWKGGKMPNIDLWASISRLLEFRMVEVVYVENPRTSRLMAYCVELATEQAVAAASLVNPE